MTEEVNSLLQKRIEYSELSKAKISDARNVVISSCSKGGFTVAQQLEANDSGKVTSVFLKGAIHVDNIEGLYNLRDAVNLAIKHTETPDKNENKDWDE